MPGRMLWLVACGGRCVDGGQRDASLTTVTSTYLLEGLRKAENRTVWQQFVDRYRPLIAAYARRLGLSDQDAEDAAQDTLMTFCSSYQKGKYQREKGRLRDWLFGITRNHVMNLRRKRRGREVQIVDRTDHTDFFARVPSEDEQRNLWEQEWRRAVLRQCLHEVRAEFDPTTLEAFELSAWKGWPTKQVAKHLAMTSNAVFIAKHRVLKRIRQLVPQMEELW